MPDTLKRVERAIAILLWPETIETDSAMTFGVGVGVFHWSTPGREWDTVLNKHWGFGRH